MIQIVAYSGVRISNRNTPSARITPGMARGKNASASSQRSQPTRVRSTTQDTSVASTTVAALDATTRITVLVSARPQRGSASTSRYTSSDAPDSAPSEGGVNVRNRLAQTSASTGSTSASSK